MKLALPAFLLTAAVAFAQPKLPEVVVPVPHTGPIEAAQFSPDGKLAVTGSADGSVSLWDAHTGELLRRMAKHYRDIHFVGFINGSERVVAASYSEPIIVWDCATGAVVRELKTKGQTAMAFSRDGERIVVTDFAKSTISVLDGASGKELRVLNAFGPGAKDSFPYPVLAISRDSARLAAIAATGEWIIAKVETGERIAAGRLPGTSATRSVSAIFSPNDASLLLADDSNLYRSDLDGVSNLPKVDAGLNPIAAVDATGRFVTSGHSGRSGATVKDMKDGTVQSVGTVILWTAACFSGDGARLLIGSCVEDERYIPVRTWAIIWDTKAAKTALTLQPPALAPMLLRLAGTRLTIASVEGAAAEWDLAAGAPPKPQQAKNVWNSSATASSADGRFTVKSYSGLGSRAVLTSPSDPQFRRDFQIDDDQVRACTISGDGARVATAMSSRKAVLWDATSGAQLRTFQVAEDEPDSIVLSADGKTLATGMLSGKLILWDVDSGKQLRSFTAHAEPVNVVVMTPDAKRVFTAARDGTTRLWNAATGAELARLVLLNDGKDWLVVTPDGRFDGSPEALKLIKVRADGLLKLEPLEKYAKALQRPGLLAEVWKGAK
jgi:WD40 repeat protein